MVEPSFPVSVSTHSTHCSLAPAAAGCRNVGLQALCRGIFSTADTAEPQDPVCTVPMARRGSPGATPLHRAPGCHQTHWQPVVWQHTVLAVPWSLHLCFSEQAPPDQCQTLTPTRSTLEAKPSALQHHTWPWECWE